MDRKSLKSLKSPAAGYLKESEIDLKVRFYIVKFFIHTNAFIFLLAMQKISNYCEIFWVFVGFSAIALLKKQQISDLNVMTIYKKEEAKSSFVFPVAVLNNNSQFSLVFYFLCSQTMPSLTLNWPKSSSVFDRVRTSCPLNR